MEMLGGQSFVKNYNALPSLLLRYAQNTTPSFFHRLSRYWCADSTVANVSAAHCFGKTSSMVHPAAEGLSGHPLVTKHHEIGAPSNGVVFLQRTEKIAK